MGSAMVLPSHSISADCTGEGIRHALLRPWQSGRTARIKVLYGVRPLLQLDNHLMEGGEGAEASQHQVKFLRFACFSSRTASTPNRAD